MNPKLVRVVGVVVGASLDGMRAVVSSLRSGTPVGTMMGYIERYGVKTLEEGLAAGVPFEYMEVMR